MDAAKSAAPSNDNASPPGALRSPNEQPPLDFGVTFPPPVPVDVVVAALVVVLAPPPAPPLPGGVAVVTTSSVPRFIVARWNEGAKSEAIGAKVADADATSASVAVLGTTRMMPTLNAALATGAGVRAPFVVTI